MEQVKDDILWGADRIAAEIGVDRRQAFYMLEKGRLPARKIGRSWCASRTGLKKFFADIMNGEVRENADASER